MSEIISHVQIPESLSDQYAEIDYMEEKGGKTGFYARDKKDDYRKRSEADVLQGFGHDLNSKQIVEAIWHASEFDNPVRIIGIIGESAGEVYYKAEGTLMGIPASQLEWKTEQLSSKEDSEPIEELKQRFNQLESKFQGLEQQVKDMQQTIDSLQDSNRKLEKEKADLLEENERLKTGKPSIEAIKLPENSKLETQFDKNDRVKYEEDKQVTTGWTVLSSEVVTDDLGHKVIPLQGPNGEFRYVNPDALQEMQKLDITDKETVIVDIPAESAVVAETIETTPTGTRTTTVEETTTTPPTVERTFWERRRGGLATVAAALIGLAGIGYIAHEAEEIEDNQPVPQKTEAIMKKLDSIQAQDKTYSVKVLNSDIYRNRLLDKANKQRAQEIENLKNIQRLLRQTKRVDVQSRNNFRRVNFRLSQLTSQTKIDASR